MLDDCSLEEVGARGKPLLKKLARVLRDTVIKHLDHKNTEIIVQSTRITQILQKLEDLKL